MRSVSFIVLAALLCVVAHSATALTADCSNFNYETGCASGTQTDNNPDLVTGRAFQTPLRGSASWKPSYQDYAQIVGYPRINYAADHMSATVTPIVFVRDPSATIVYTIESQQIRAIQLSAMADPPVFTFNATSTLTEVTIVATVSHSDGSKSTLTMEPIHFMWLNKPLPAHVQAGPYNNGQKGAIVEMFGWPYDDVAAECAMLAKAGYMGVKVFPPLETILSFEWLQNGELNPWWFLYQPVSYKFFSRMGNRAQLRNMIDTCRALGVRVYADAVVNHMTGGGNDIQNHRNPAGSSCATWGPKSSAALSPYFTQDFNYENNTNTGLHPGLEFPAVPYMAEHFHCERSLNSWTDPFILNAGWLDGLSDLNSENQYVRDRISDFMVDLLGFGFSGFRIDAAKHMAPDNIASILGLFKVKLGNNIPADFITYLEVLIGGEKSLLECDYSPYDYALYFNDAMTKNGLSADDIAKVKIWSSDYPKEFPICGSWIIPSERFVAQNDCHDDQNPGSSSRDMGDKGSVLVIQKDVPTHRAFEVQLFTRTDGNWQIKAVLSSYSFMNNGAMGFPDGMSDCSKYNGTVVTSCKSMAYSKAYNPNSCGYDCLVNGAWVEGVYTRVHRDKSIILAMRGWQGLSTNVQNADIGLPSNCA